MNPRATWLAAVLAGCSASRRPVSAPPAAPPAADASAEEIDAAVPTDLPGCRGMVFRANTICGPVLRCGPARRIVPANDPCVAALVRVEGAVTSAREHERDAIRQTYPHAASPAPCRLPEQRQEREAEAAVRAALRTRLEDAVSFRPISEAERREWVRRFDSDRPEWHFRCIDPGTGAFLVGVGLSVGIADNTPYTGMWRVHGQDVREVYGVSPERTAEISAAVDLVGDAVHEELFATASRATGARTWSVMSPAWEEPVTVISECGGRGEDPCPTLDVANVETGNVLVVDGEVREWNGHGFVPSRTPPAALREPIDALRALGERAAQAYEALVRRPEGWPGTRPPCDEPLRVHWAEDVARRLFGLHVAAAEAVRLAAAPAGLSDCAEGTAWGRIVASVRASDAGTDVQGPDAR